MMESFLRLRFEQLFTPSLFVEKEVDPFVVAETVWATSNRNLLQFFDEIDAERYQMVKFEDLVKQPEATMQGLCQFLEIPFQEALIHPYDGKRERMMGGLGDPNILRHQQIDPKLADVWKSIQLPRPLDSGTIEIAKRLGYEVNELQGDSAGMELSMDELDLNEIIEGMSDEDMNSIFE